MSRAGLSFLVVAVVGTASCLIANDFEKVDEGSGGSGASTTSSGGSGAGGSGTGVGPGGAGGTGGTASGTGGTASGTGGTASGTGGGGPELCPTDACLPDCDDFNAGNLDGWSVSTAPPAGQSITFPNGGLAVTIDDAIGTNYAWYNAERGWWAWQPACGDFAVTVKVSVTAASGSGTPSANFNSGGLLVRGTNGTAPNDDFWAMVNIGRQANAGQLGVETKGTQHSVSDPIDFHDVLSGMLEGEVGMCRVGDRLHLSAKAPAGPWQHLATYGPFQSGTLDGEVSLADSVELGLVVNGYTQQDARVTFDDATFWIPQSKDDCPAPGSDD